MTTHVLISGASGFIAAHTVAALLAAGHTVTGTVRRPDDSQSTAHLRALPGAERLRLVAADLEDPSAFDAHVADVDHVIHMASPFRMDVADARRDLLEPAVAGTHAMLRACARAPRVQRVVLTSSMAAVTDEPDTSHVLTEDDWNVRSSLTRNPYYYSKAEAERAAWRFVEQERPRWDLVAINPFIVVGPSLSGTISESNKLLVDLMNGAYPAVMALTWGFVDVRDVAAAHVRALTAPAANGRYLCVAGNRSMREVVALLRASGYAHTRLPRRGLDSALGNHLARLAAFTQPRGVASYLRTHLGRVPRYDCAKIMRDLDLAFRDVDQSLLETAADLVRHGHVAPAPRAA
ncbi:MAG: NAD-dependent epimerase/dehydratase family protein [Gammaproteobacteria bacterium]